MYLLSMCCSGDIRSFSFILSLIRKYFIIIFSCWRCYTNWNFEPLEESPIPWVCISLVSLKCTCLYTCLFFSWFFLLFKERHPRTHKTGIILPPFQVLGDKERTEREVQGRSTHQQRPRGPKGCGRVCYKNKILWYQRRWECEQRTEGWSCACARLALGGAGG